MKYTFPCNIAPDTEEGGWGFVVSFPDVKGAHTSGKTFKEAIILAEDCMVVALSAYIHLGHELPTPSPYQEGQELLTVQPSSPRSWTCTLPCASRASAGRNWRSGLASAAPTPTGC